MGRTREFDEQDILERATRWVWRNGLASTSMRDIVATTGLGKASIYNAYGSREAFFRRMLTYYIEKRQSQSLSLLDNTRSGRGALEDYFQGVLQSPSDESYMSGCLIINVTTEQSPLDEETRAILDLGMKMIRDQLIDAMQRGIRDGSINSQIKPEKTVPCLIATILGLYVMKRQGICQHQLQDMINASLDALGPDKPRLQEAVA
ncbi:transcriptional regulator, TetR family [Cohaesibacter sp. ES.047]|uniref:TetR/AcrR family transcriptional regulator n=1 Tax=Cohaesibacter sp. ES.047 TaxID=1798205 RepID=UPI000BB779B0|nr:helix-turn-helix domain-containing protein [Cohaesibacter sp. ES.047]SNY90994.1 transcriptional regulator, TetR family [Cohaesibacter sp. ES.047]